MRRSESLGTGAPTAIVLAGGQSTRLGRDKAAVEVNGVALLDGVVRVLHHITDDILIVEAPSQLRPNLPTRVSVRRIHDERVGVGPLGGLHAGLGASRPGHAWVVACDIPFPHAGLLTRMMLLADGYDAVVPMWLGKP